MSASYETDIYGCYRQLQATIAKNLQNQAPFYKIHRPLPRPLNLPIHLLAFKHFHQGPHNQHPAKRGLS